MNQHDVKKDIASFVRYKVNRMPNLSAPAHQRPKTLVIDELSKKENHKGMFLWVYLMCKKIKAQDSVAKIQQLLQALPTGLAAVYMKILQHLDDKPLPDQIFVQRVFQWVVGSIRPLRWNELDQALGIDRFRPCSFEDDDEYAETYIYSRRDVVKVCGSLVQYSGLDYGDTIRLIHLSAREFLQGKAYEFAGFRSELSKYLVDANLANTVLARACLSILQSPDVQGSGYFLMDPKSEECRLHLIRICPLVEYAVLYWPEFVCAIKHPLSSPAQDYRGLLIQMIGSSWSLHWLEEYIRLCGIEFAEYTAERIGGLEQDNNSDESPFTSQAWAALVSHGLHTFAETISRCPQALHTCIGVAYYQVACHSTRYSTQSLITLGNSNTGSEETKPLPKGWLGWLGYDRKSRSLFLIDKQRDSMRVSRRHIDRSIAYRQVLEAGEQTPYGSWFVRSAELKQDATFLAVTFSPQDPQQSYEPVYRTVCWSVSNSTHSFAAAADWAQIIIVDRSESSLFHAVFDL